jgi:L-amino acid N-acyltransferase YncA
MIEITGMRPTTMCETKSTTSKNGAKAGALRIEPVDNWHGGWDKVLASIERHGKPKKLKIDAEGWLSARQVLTVAFIGETPVAHVCFSVSPSKEGCIEARLDSYGIDPKCVGRGIESQLHQAAVDRAQALQCATLKGFKFNSKWC